MTEKNAKAVRDHRKLTAVILLTLAGILLVSAVAGFILQGTRSVKDDITAMRYQAVLHAATSGLVESYANEAYSTKQKDMRKNDPDYRKRGENANDEILNKVKEEARAEAEVLYGNPVVEDEEAFHKAVDELTPIVSASSDREEKEKAVYKESYLQLINNVASWRTVAPEDADDEVIRQALLDVAPELDDADKHHLTDGFVRMARDMARKEQDKEDRESKNQLLDQMASQIDSWSDYADLEDDALWDKVTAEMPELAEHEAWKAEIVDGAKQCADAAKNESDLPSWSNSGSEEEGAATSGDALADYTYFTASDELLAEQQEMDKAYEAVQDQLFRIIPELKNEKARLLDKLKDQIEMILSQSSKAFITEYETYAENGGEKAITGSPLLMKLIALAKYWLLAGIAVLLLGLVILYWKKLTTSFGVPRTIIMLFFIFLCLLAEGYRISVGMMLGNVLERMTMYGVLVLAMMPGIQCGIGLNMGMTIGCISGLLGIIIVLEHDLTGFGAMLLACLLGMIIALPLGWGYSKLLNRMKGNEMTISTYVGYSFVSLMCIGWMLLPFKNPKLVWPLLGWGMRVTHGLLGRFAHILDNALAFKVFGIKIPTGGLLFLGVCCVLMWLFTRTKTGIAMKAVGSNPRFAEASGISVDRMRTIGTMLSTVIAAVGIVIYSQAFGYAQLYNAPRQLGFIASSAILIGGATVTKAKVSHVLLGVFLFEGVLVFGQQIANSAVSGGGLSEVMRIMISNGIILYALTQSGGGKRE